MTDKHERFLNTAETGSCYTTLAGSEHVVNVFRRRLDGDRINDGMPLMYALKRTKDFRVDGGSLAVLRRRALDRLARHFAASQVDVVVPAPSSSGLPLCLANTLAPVLGCGVEVIEALRKPTIGSVLASRTALRDVRGADQTYYKRAVSIMMTLDLNDFLAVKGIHSRARPYFRTVELQAQHRLPQGKHLLVIDDSCSSGTTLRDAIGVLRRVCQPASIRGVALIGPS